jgi:hypothetical protein
MLDSDSTKNSVECTLKLNQEGIANGLDFTSSMACKKRTKETSMPFQRLKSGRLVLLGKGGIAYNVREHYRRESPLALGQGLLSVEDRSHDKAVTGRSGGWMPEALRSPGV